ncbi:uncharacterized protein LOC129912744 [Episyrphus balteatus]|uniref:uncharacterized protein LOC129912744 n=1 Tax=Episyrphus balteatus TaxID=286459 RepID=UPI00248581DC|nr:uncharacterized protein LOC129912744 [Episyrphus balteatus]
MLDRPLICKFTSPYFLHQVWANSTIADFRANTNSTFAPPKQSSYFYQDTEGSETYEFGYRVEDKSTENIQFRNETLFSNGTVTGSYGYLRADGIFTVVNYVADDKGYRTKRKKKVNKNHHSKESSETQSTITTTATTTTTSEIPPLNLTSGTLPPLLVDKVMDQFQIDLSPDASPGDILHPNISDIIDGKIPLKMAAKNAGFDVVQNFIPMNFPIAPFQLPTDKPSKSKDD